MTSRKNSGIKAHGWHVVTQQLLSLCIRVLYIVDLVQKSYHCCGFQDNLCNKLWTPTIYMSSFNEDVAVTILILEIHMPPSFFDVISHMVLYLVTKLELSGSVHHDGCTSWRKRKIKIKMYFKLNLSICILSKLICKLFASGLFVFILNQSWLYSWI